MVAVSERISALISGRDPEGLGILGLGDFVEMMRVTGRPPQDIIQLVLCSGAAHVRYVDFLNWLFKKQSMELADEKQPHSGEWAGEHQSQIALPAHIGASPYESVWKAINVEEAVQRNAQLSKNVKDKVAKSVAAFEDPNVEIWQQDLIYTTQSLNVLKSNCEHVKRGFDSRVVSVLADMKTTWHNAPVDNLSGTKGLERASKKCLVKFAGDASQMSDMVRGTVVVHGNVDDLYKVVEHFMSAPTFNTRFSHFTHFADRYQRPLGDYRDILTLVRIGGHVCELQFNLELVLAIKESPEGHGSYEKDRLVNDDLLQAVMTNNVECAMTALGKGASPTVREGKHGLSCTHFAAFHNSVDLLRKLLEHSADPHAVDRYGALPLHRAVTNQCREASHVLVDCMVPETVLSALTEKSGRLLMWCAEMAIYTHNTHVTQFLAPLVLQALDHEVLEVRESAALGVDTILETKGDAVAHKIETILAEAGLRDDVALLGKFALQDLAADMCKELIDEVDGKQVTLETATVVGHRLLPKCREARFDSNYRLMNPTGISALVAGLGNQVCTNLQYICLNDITGERWCVNASRALGNFLAKCPALKSLQLAYNSPMFETTESLKAMQAGLGNSVLDAVERLDLSFDEIAPHSAEQLGQFLAEKTPNLTELVVNCSTSLTSAAETSQWSGRPAWFPPSVASQGKQLPFDGDWHNNNENSRWLREGCIGGLLIAIRGTCLTAGGAYNVGNLCRAALKAQSDKAFTLPSLSCSGEINDQDELVLYQEGDLIFKGTKLGAMLPDPDTSLFPCNRFISGTGEHGLPNLQHLIAKGMDDNARYAYLKKWPHLEVSV